LVAATLTTFDNEVLQQRSQLPPRGRKELPELILAARAVENLKRLEGLDYCVSGIVKYPDMYLPVDVDGDDARRPLTAGI
jgi:hypothetical protein